MAMLSNVGKLLLLQEEHAPAVVQVQSAASFEARSPEAVASPGLMLSGGTVEAKPGEAVLVPAVAPAVIAKAVPAPKGKWSGVASAVTIGAAAVYSLVGDQVLDLIVDILTQQGAIERVVSHKATALTLFAILVWWKDARRRKREAKAAAQ